MTKAELSTYEDFREVFREHLPRHIADKLFMTALAAVDGRRVAVRLNLNANVQGPVHTVHGAPTPRGRVIGYEKVVGLSDVEFYIDQAARAKIAKGEINKRPMAAVVGNFSRWGHGTKGATAVVRFNPKTSHLFVREDDGRAVRSAERATIYENRVYLHGEVKYWSAEEAPKPLEGIVSDARFE